MFKICFQSLIILSRSDYKTLTIKPVLLFNLRTFFANLYTQRKTSPAISTTKLFGYYFIFFLWKQFYIVVKWFHKETFRLHLLCFPHEEIHLSIEFLCRGHHSCWFSILLFWFRRLDRNIGAGFEFGYLQTKMWHLIYIQHLHFGFWDSYNPLMQ
jgi:hypothetical protein